MHIFAAFFLCLYPTQSFTHLLTHKLSYRRASVIHLLTRNRAHSNSLLARSPNFTHFWVDCPIVHYIYTVRWVFRYVHSCSSCSPSPFTFCLRLLSQRKKVCIVKAFLTLEMHDILSHTLTRSEETKTRIDRVAWNFEWCTFARETNGSKRDSL